MNRRTFLASPAFAAPATAVPQCKSDKSIWFTGTLAFEAEPGRARVTFRLDTVQSFQDAMVYGPLGTGAVEALTGRLYHLNAESYERFKRAWAEFWGEKPE